MTIDVESVKKLLKALVKYDATKEDDFLIELAIEERTDFVLSYCNREDIPKRLRSQLLRMIVGEFLYQKKSVGGTEALGIETLALVSSITEKDTKVDFEHQGEISDERALDDWIRRLRRGHRATLQEFRRMKWAKKRHTFH